MKIAKAIVPFLFFINIQSPAVGQTSDRVSASSVEVYSEFMSSAGMNRTTNSPYYEAKLYSEGDGTFRFQSFGCEFKIENPIIGKDKLRVFARELKTELEGNQAGPTQRTSFFSLMSNARRTSIVTSMPTHFRCDSSVATLIQIVDLDSNQRRHYSFGIRVFQISIADLEAHIDRPRT